MEFGNYREFQRKVTDAFRRIESRHEKEFRCRPGCHECCKPGLTVNALEKAALKEFLKTHPEALDQARRNAGTNPWKGARCEFLDDKGSCLVYEARPIVCRSHGAPLQFRDPETKKPDEALRFRDVCPLNFASKGIDSLPHEDVLNLDTINTLLSLLNRAYCRESGADHDERFLLNLKNIL